MIKAYLQKVKDNFDTISIMHSIKAIIIDVDGVMVGEKIGLNSPNPTPQVIEKFKQIKNKGIPVILCTAKPHYSVTEIINDAGLDNLHITQGGAVLINPLNTVFKKIYYLDKHIAREVIKTVLYNNTYCEIYSLDNYYIQKNQINKLTETHTFILQKPPIAVNSLLEESEKHAIVKIMPVVKDNKEKDKINELITPFFPNIQIGWGVHPIALPHLFGTVTNSSASKGLAVTDITKAINVNPDQILAIGDSDSDWNFMKLCGYKGTLSNAQDGLKNRFTVLSKDKYFIGKSVDEDGVIDVLNYFDL